MAEYGFGCRLALRRLRAEQADDVTPSLMRPHFSDGDSARVAAREHEGRGTAKFNLDRLLNRFIDYPRHLQRGAP